MSLNKSMIVFLMIMISSLFMTQSAYADFPYNGEWWLNAGVGSSSGSIFDVPLPPIPPSFYQSEKDEAKSLAGTAVETSLNFATTDHQLVTLRVLKTDAIVGDIGTGQVNAEVGLLYGLMAKARYGYISASAGLSYIDTGYEGGTDYLGVHFNDVHQPTIGLPTEVQAFFTPFRYVGVGLVGYADISRKASVGGGLLELQIGNLFPGETNTPVS